uniref:Uncharacterized protein n=1 Tax=Clytia hemisphaerica TaxID=252671 RepID=A0A7M5X4C3_9CNID|eukprot:TCONS_00060299-protein
MTLEAEETIMKALAGPISLSTVLVTFGPYFSSNYLAYVIIFFVVIIGIFEKMEWNRKEKIASKYSTIRSISRENSKNFNNTENRISQIETIENSNATPTKESKLKKVISNVSPRHKSMSTPSKKAIRPRLKELRSRFSKSYHYSIEEKK